MAQEYKRTTTYRRDGTDIYLMGNVVRKEYVHEVPDYEEPLPRRAEQTRKRPPHTRKEIRQEKRARRQEVAILKNRDKARHMSPGYMLFLTSALLLSAVILIGYIMLESSITTSVKKIASLESELNTLKTENDEAYSQIESSVDLEEIRRIAITELGMTYPDADQVVIVPDEGTDYVKQLNEID